MNEWFAEFFRTNSGTQLPLPPPNPQLGPVALKGVELVRLNKPSIDKIRKQGAEEFRENVNDDLERAEFWLENSIRVFNELSCTPDECLKCALSLLKDTTYQWWNTLISVVPRERVTWDFFQEKFREKNINQRFIDQKHKEFLELKHGRRTVIEYEQVIVRLKIEIFVCSINASAGYPNKDCGKLYSDSKAQTMSVASVRNARSIKPEYQHCDRRHLDECSMNNRACFRSGSQDHFIRDCPEMVEKDNFQNARSSNTAARGRLVRNTRNGTSSRVVSKDSTVRSKARAPARAYDIRAREDASSPSVITSTSSLYDTNQMDPDRAIANDVENISAFSRSRDSAD
ncbi:uncharacterized protein LOC128291580 [Gossypium arboreum]|uniref:uncharacterized protein LOC128291580 n=1 Tax=Gossypium arboreum TaxID=29729 RepID=UPI0022F14F60|nr:uncharacterized protein LOC128291580 [Gossypium arboreum]